MNKYTYCSAYIGEVRNLQLTVCDEYDNAFYPTSSTAYVRDLDEIVIIPETSCTIDDNVVTYSLSASEISSIGDYEIIWKICDTDTINYHKTKLTINNI